MAAETFGVSFDEELLDELEAARAEIGSQPGVRMPSRSSFIQRAVRRELARMGRLDADECPEVEA